LAAYDRLSKKIANSPEDSQQLLLQISEVTKKILKIINVLNSI